MKNKKLLKYIFIPFSILFIIYFSYFVISYIQIVYSAHFLESCYLPEYLRVNIYGNSYNNEDSDTISAKISVMDSNSSEIVAVERSWNGTCLAVKFNQLSIGDFNYYFPSKIFGKESFLDKSNPKNYTSLEKYYDENRECILLSQIFSRKKERRALFVLSRFANKKKYIPTFGFVKVVTVDLFECENGKFYSIVPDSNGKLKVVEL